MNGTYFIIINQNPRQLYEKDVLFCLDLKREIIKVIDRRIDDLQLFDSFYDRINKKSYIIVSFNDKIKSYDFNTNLIYKIYNNYYNGKSHNFIVNNNQEIIKLIVYNAGYTINIFNFHSGKS